jgi:hypothetical protein
VRRRALKGGPPGGYTAARSFDLVQAVRINGRPRQKFLLGLGSQKDVERYEGDVVHFWLLALFRLKERGFKPKRRRQIVAQMIKKGARLPSLADCNNEDLTVNHWYSAAEKRELRAAVLLNLAAAAP